MIVEVLGAVLTGGVTATTVRHALADRLAWAQGLLARVTTFLRAR